MPFSFCQVLLELNMIANTPRLYFMFCPCFSLNPWPLKGPMSMSCLAGGCTKTACYMSLLQCSAQKLSFYWEIRRISRSCQDWNFNEREGCQNVREIDASTQFWITFSPYFSIFSTSIILSIHFVRTKLIYSHVTDVALRHHPACLLAPSTRMSFRFGSLVRWSPWPHNAGACQFTLAEA